MIAPHLGRRVLVPEPHLQIRISYMCLAGKIATTFFTGDTKITDTAVYLKTTIDRYNEALQKLNVRIALKVYQHLKCTKFFQTILPGN